MVTDMHRHIESFPVYRSSRVISSNFKQSIMLRIILASGIIFGIAMVVTIVVISNVVRVADVSVPKSHIYMGPGTQQLLGTLRQQGFAVEPRMTVRKQSLSVQGVVVSFLGDSIQMYEYPDNATALVAETQLETQYISTANHDTWKSVTHFYVKNNILILYIGYNETIGASLNEALKKWVS